MRLLVAFLALALGGLGVGAPCSQSSEGHKSSLEIERMTPEQRVAEYCKEYARHDVWDREYSDTLSGYIKRDGLKAVPAATKIIAEFDPTNPKRKSAKKDVLSHSAEILLGTLDQASFRLRAFVEGKAAISALSRLIERMRIAGFVTAPVQREHSPQARYTITLHILNQIQGASLLDKAVRDTLELKYNVKMRDEELLDFSNYLTSQDPYYPAWSETEWYVDRKKLNEAGNPLQYLVVKNIEPFYNAFLKYHSKPH